MPDDELDELEGSMRRRQRLARLLYLVFAALPLVVIGYCVKQDFLTKPPPASSVPPSGGELRSMRELVRARDRAEGRRLTFTAPAAILDQLRHAQPSEAGCPIALHARSADVSQYEPPAFDLIQLTPSELDAAVPGNPPAQGGDAIEVVFVTAHRIEGDSDGVTFMPGEVAGRAFLWSRREGRIVCVGDVTATNSPSIDVHRASIGGEEVVSTGEDDRGILEADLDRQLERAIAAGLHAAAVR